MPALLHQSRISKIIYVDCGAKFNNWSLSKPDNIGFKLGLVFFIGGPLLAKRCAVGMIATAAGIGLALLLSAQ